MPREYRVFAAINGGGRKGGCNYNTVQISRFERRVQSLKIRRSMLQIRRD